jgi:hypothetical protein
VCSQFTIYHVKENIPMQSYKNGISELVFTISCSHSYMLLVLFEKDKNWNEKGNSPTNSEEVSGNLVVTFKKYGT